MLKNWLLPAVNKALRAAGHLVKPVSPDDLTRLLSRLYETPAGT